MPAQTNPGLASFGELSLIFLSTPFQVCLLKNGENSISDFECSVVCGVVVQLVWISL